jgi:DNA mismatch endonuclease (patch repair protein)
MAETESEPQVTPARSANMAKVRGKDTKPELAVRRAAHALGLRFRIHRRDLPGTPDLVFPKRKTAIFVHGCFWHRHEGCRKAGAPKTRAAFWEAKFDRNTARDARNADALRAEGWNVAIVWECDTRDPAKLAHQLRSIFNLPDRVARTGS